MASRKDIEAGRAYVTLGINSSALIKGLNAVGTRMQSFGTSIARIGGIMTAAGGTLLAPFVGAIKAASDMEETMSKFSIVFGASAGDVKAWSDTLAGSVGRSKQQVASFMAASQDLFVPLGFAADAATDLSKQVTQLAIDLGSFNNMADEDVMRDLQAAVTGSGEVMKKYGVLVNEAAVKQELLNQGLDPKTANDQMKVQARLNIIMRGTTAAQGDALRTAGGFANQMKALQGNIKDTAVEIGAALLPVVTPLITKISSVVKLLAGWVVGNTALVKTAAMVAAGIAAAGVVFVGLGSSVAFLGIVISGCATVFGALLSPVALVVSAITAGTAAFITFTDTGRWLAETLMGDFGTAFGTIKDTIGGVVDALNAGEFKLAGEIAMTGLKAAFLQAIQTIVPWWRDFAKTLVNVLSEAAKGITATIGRIRTNVLALTTRVKQTLSEDTRDEQLAELESMRGSLPQREYIRRQGQILQAHADRMRAVVGAADTGMSDISSDMAGILTTIDSLTNSATNFAEAITPSDADLARLQEELRILRNQAAAAAGRLSGATGPPSATTAAAGITSGVGGSGGAVAATFSSAALTAMGQGGGTLGKIHQTLREQKLILQNQVKAIERSGLSVAEKLAAIFAIQS